MGYFNEKLKSVLCQFYSFSGGGVYNEEGQKQGEWTDIDNNFKKQK